MRLRGNLVSHNCCRAPEMNWLLKARLQRNFARLPFLKEDAYYLAQRTFGRRISTLDPFFMLQACAELVAYLQAAGRPVEGSRVMEVGTGRGVDMPLGFFLCGAASVVTFDLHRYLRPAIVMESVRTLCGDKDRVLKTLSPVYAHKGLQERLESICSAPNSKEVMRRANIEYRAPADAANTGLPDHSIDVQISYTVFEHIPRDVLRAILVEANRILATDGLALHHIDPSDHFSHEDRSILPINFLQFSDAEWSRIAGNQWAYHNRLRAAEFADLYEECGHQVLLWKPVVDPESRKALENGFAIHPQFQKHPVEVLSTVVLQVLSKPSGNFPAK
jgi:SAM-dependent methyltransferase